MARCPFAQPGHLDMTIILKNHNPRAVHVAFALNFPSSSSYFEVTFSARHHSSSSLSGSAPPSSQAPPGPPTNIPTILLEELFS